MIFFSICVYSAQWLHYRFLYYISFYVMLSFWKKIIQSLYLLLYLFIYTFLEFNLILVYIGTTLNFLIYCNRMYAYHKIYIITENSIHRNTQERFGTKSLKLCLFTNPYTTANFNMAVDPNFSDTNIIKKK